MCSDYLGDLLRLRNILAALARPAPTIASQGVSLATAASKTLVSSLLGGGLRGRVSAIKASSTSAIASNAPPAIAYATASPNALTSACASAKPNRPMPKKTALRMVAIKTALPINRPNMKSLHGLSSAYTPSVVVSKFALSLISCSMRTSKPNDTRINKLLASFDSEIRSAPYIGIKANFGIGTLAGLNRKTTLVSGLATEKNRPQESADAAGDQQRLDGLGAHMGAQFLGIFVRPFLGFVLVFQGCGLGLAGGFFRQRHGAVCDFFSRAHGQGRPLGGNFADVAIKAFHIGLQRLDVGAQRSQPRINIAGHLLLLGHVSNLQLFRN